MSTCECLARCPFFHDEMKSMPRTGDLMKGQYCDGPRASSEKCARHMVFTVMGREGVPSDLYPSEAARAKQIIGRG